MPQKILLIRMTDVPSALASPESGASAEVTLTKPFSPTQLIAEIKRLLPETKCA